MSENNENIQMNVTETAETPAETQQQVDSNTPVTVPLYLLLNIRNIIDVGTSRGTFKSNELSSVGKVYDELATVINTVAQEVVSQSKTTQPVATPETETN